MNDGKKSVSVSSKLYDTISKRIKNSRTGFSSVEEYVNFVLSELLFDEEDNLENEKINETSEEETKKIRDELKKMGYI